LDPGRGHRPGCRRAGETDYAGKDPGGIIITMLLGVAGSYVATYLTDADRLVPRRAAGRVHHVGGGSRAAARDLSFVSEKDGLIDSRAAAKAVGTRTAMGDSGAPE